MEENKASDITKQTAIQMPDSDLMQLADRIVAVIDQGKQQLAISINQTMKSTYWNVGRHIVMNFWLSMLHTEWILILLSRSTNCSCQTKKSCVSWL